MFGKEQPDIVNEDDVGDYVHELQNEPPIESSFPVEEIDEEGGDE